MAPRDSDEFKRDAPLRSPFRASSAIPAFPHVLISASLETRKRQIVASVSVRFPGRSSEACSANPVDAELFQLPARVRTH